MEAVYHNASCVIKPFSKRACLRIRSFYVRECESLGDQTSP